VRCTCSATAAQAELAAFTLLRPPYSAAPAAASFLLCCPQSTGKNTFFGKTATMLQSADGLGHLQKILMSIVISLVVISLVLCITMLIYLMVYGKESLKEALTFVVVVLVVSIPIAIEIVCTTTLAIGSRQVRQADQCGGDCGAGGLRWFV
jgi:magnesium-transporting ATPase (P-type)